MMMKANLDTLTCDYNTLAEANGFPTRDKRFRSHKDANASLRKLEKDVLERMEMRAKNKERVVGECVDSTGWDVSLVKSMTEMEQRRAVSMMELISRAEQDQNKWLEDFDRDPTYALTWAGSVAEASVKAKVSNILMASFEKQSGGEESKTFTQWCREFRDAKREELISNQFRGESTSPWSNAMDSSTRTAISSMVSSWGEFGWVDMDV